MHEGDLPTMACQVRAVKEESTSSETHCNQMTRLGMLNRCDMSARLFQSRRYHWEMI